MKTIGDKIERGPNWAKAREENVTTACREALHAIKTVKSLHLYTQVSRRIRDKCALLVNSCLKLQQIESLIASVFILLLFGDMLGVVSYGLTAVASGTLPIGQLLSFILMLLMVTYALGSIGDAVAIYNKMMLNKRLTSRGST